MDTEELRQNIEVTARRLTGRIVKVRIRQPILDIAENETYNAGGGVIVIDLSPETVRDPKRFLKSFTHEAAHAKLHAANMPAIETNRPSASFKTNESDRRRLLQNKAFQKRESEAERQADEWRRVVDACGWYYKKHTGDPVLAILKALYHQTQRG